MSARQLRHALALVLALVGAGAASACAAARVRDTPAPVVVIDPGHPSETAAGDVLLNGAREVEIAWSTSLRLRDALQRAGIRVVMTKSAVRELVTNRRRAEIANEAGAALLVRLHTDAGQGRGFTLYHPDRQGQVNGVTGPSQAVITESARAARVLHDSMAPRLRGSLRDGGILGDSRTLIGSRQGALTGSIYSTVPAVTIEMVFLTNADDARFIQSPAGQQAMADAIARGVIAWTRAR